MDPTALNVNLKPCGCSHRRGLSSTCLSDCASAPVLIPCPLPPSVTVAVVLGECNCTIPSWWTRDAMAHSKADRASGRAWSCACGPCAAARSNGWAPDQHNARCPARPVKVSCSISSPDGSWEKSEVTEVDGPFWGNALEACRERWAVVKALVLGQRWTSQLGSLERVATMFDRRDAAYGALADMTRHEDGIESAQHAFFSALNGHGKTVVRIARPSHSLLEAYVERLIEQVGTIQGGV